MNFSTLIILCMLIITACKSNKESAGNEQELSEQLGNSDTQSAVDRVLFVNFNLVYDSISQSYGGDVINHTVSRGSLREPTQSKRYAEPGDVRFTMLDENERQTKEVIIANPLKRRAEFVNDEGQLETQELFLSHVQHFLRAQILDNSIKFKLEIIAADSLGNDKLLYSGKIE